MAKSIWKDYFTFSKGERISVYILLAILVIAIAGPYYYARKFKTPAVEPVLQQQLSSLLQENYQDSLKTGLSDSKEPDNSNSISGSTLFYFDPNKLDAAGFKQLGLRDKTIQTIVNYRNKGGYFRKAEDIRKIYGLHEDEASRLIPYIRMESDKTTATKQEPVFKEEKPKPAYKKIDINTATEEEWKALPGIGDVLSKRIIKFRNSIHGFKSVNDISKTYGLSDSAFQLILPYLTISEPAAQ
jgi:competence protein ComEA